MTAPGTQLACEVMDFQHPHFGCRGYIAVSEADTVTVITMFGKRKVEVFLTDCPHGTSSCYVDHKPGVLRFDGGKPVRR